MDAVPALGTRRPGVLMARIDDDGGNSASPTTLRYDQGLSRTLEFISIHISLISQEVLCLYKSTGVSDTIPKVHSGHIYKATVFVDWVHGDYW